MQPGPLNPETLENLKDCADPGDPRFLGDLIRSYLDDGATRFAGLRAALREGDAARIAPLAHTLAGSSLNVGADALASRMHAIDKAAKAGTLPDEAELTACEEEFARVRSALNRLLA